MTGSVCWEREYGIKKIMEENEGIASFFAFKDSSNIFSDDSKRSFENTIIICSIKSERS